VKPPAPFQPYKIEPWAPGDDAMLAEWPLAPSEADVDPGVEQAPDAWQPVTPRAAAAKEVSFVDGVRRVDARIWLQGGPEATLIQGLCASYAIGAVTARASAEIEGVEIGRGVFTERAASAVETDIGVYRNVVVTRGDTDVLASGMIRELRALESRLAATLATSRPLVVLDGPLSEHHRRMRLVGYVKSHRVRYLPDALEKVVHALRPGERSPLFRTTTSWSRYSSYLRLPGGAAHAWDGVVRLEISGETALDEARSLTDIAAATLPRYASTPVKDARAPANLFPIGGLERALRRRLGDAWLVHRALRRAATRSIA